MEGRREDGVNCFRRPDRAAGAEPRVPPARGFSLFRRRGCAVVVGVVLAVGVVRLPGCAARVSSCAGRRSTEGGKCVQNISPWRSGRRGRPAYRSAWWDSLRHEKTRCTWVLFRATRTKRARSNAWRLHQDNPPRQRRSGRSESTYRTSWAVAAGRAGRGLRLRSRRPPRALDLNQ